MGGEILEEPECVRLEISGRILLLDRLDYEALRAYKIYIERNQQGYTLVRAVKHEAGKKIRINLASLLLPPPKGFLTLLRTRGESDVVLDYRRANLYIGTNSTRNRAKRKIKKLTSKYRGVHFRKDRGTWCARIKVSGRIIYLGSYVNEEEAALAYNTSARKFFGEHAYQNRIVRDVEE